MKFNFHPLFFSLIGLFLTHSAFAEQEAFSYCSNGRCSIITGQYFNTVRGMPVDLNVSCKKDNQYALTFDDGPSANYPRLLEILKRNNVKATFFVNGGNLTSEEAKKWFKEAFAEGHFMANHTFNHPDLTQLTDAEVYDQIEKSRDAMLKTVFPNEGSAQGDPRYEDLKASTKVVRPPFGNIDLRVDGLFKARGYTSVRWNSDRYDWDLPGTDPATPGVVVSRVLQQLDFIKTQSERGNVFNKSVLDLNHDWQKTTLDAVETFIPLIKSRGYEFVTMDECLGFK